MVPNKYGSASSLELERASRWNALNKARNNKARQCLSDKFSLANDEEHISTEVLPHRKNPRTFTVSSWSEGLIQTVVFRK